MSYFKFFLIDPFCMFSRINKFQYHLNIVINCYL